MGNESKKESKNRKTDRRTLYTRNVIKDALLEALAEKTFEQITVTDVCRRAEITPISSMRLLVVWSSPPEISLLWGPYCRIAPHPPGPGLPLQAPSV